MPSHLTKLEETLVGLMDERLLVIDGAMGTMIQRLGLSEADYKAKRYAGSDRTDRLEHARRHQLQLAGNS